jgi:hypothetical protein
VNEAMASLAASTRSVEGAEATIDAHTTAGGACSTHPPPGSSPERADEPPAITRSPADRPPRYAVSLGHIAAHVETPECRRLVAQFGQPRSDLARPGQLRVRHGVLVGGELHDRHIGVFTIPVPGRYAAGCGPLALGALQPLIEQRIEFLGATRPVLDDLDEAHDAPAACSRAHTDAPCQSIATTGSSPTTQASCPGGREVISPGPESNSVPSAITTWIRPLIWYC